MPNRLNPTIRAAIWMIGSILCFSLLAVAGRELKGKLDTFEIMLYRSIVGVILTAGFALVAGRMRDLRLSHAPLHVVRNIVHFTGQNLWFYAVTVAPLAQVFALEFTMPIWALLLAVPILGEKITFRRVVIALVGFAGILVITRPWSEALGEGILQAGLSAVFFGATAILTRLLTRDVSVLNIVFWLSVFQGLFAVLIAGSDLAIALPSGVALAWAIAIGCAGIIAHVCLTSALSLAPASVVLPIDFTRLPLIALVAYLIYGQKVDIYVFLGAIIVFAANYANILMESRKG